MNPEVVPQGRRCGMACALLAASIATLLVSAIPFSDPAAAQGPGIKADRLAGIREFGTPKEVLAWIYGHYVAGGNGLYLEDVELPRIFSPRMTDLMKRSRTASEILESESVGAAPWMGAQEWIVRDVKFDVRDAGEGRMVAVATFRNHAEERPKPRRYVYQFVRTERGWRIDDVGFPDEGSSARFGKTHDLSKMLETEIAEGETARREEVSKAEKSGSLCKFGEGTIFACRTFGRQISICTDSQLHEPPQRWIEYRSGVPYKLELVHRSEQTGGQGSFYGSRQERAGGSASYVRFTTRDGYDYAAHVDSSVTPARSGVTIRKDGKQMAEFACDGGDVEGMPSDRTKMPSNMIQAVPFDGGILR